MFPHEYYAGVGQRGMNAAPIGSGPFRVVEHALGKAITLEPNADYFAGGPKSRPAIDRVAIRFVSDAQTRVAEMVSGRADLDMYVARDQAEQLRDIEHLQIVAGDTLRYTYLALNTLASTPAPALRDARVRRAIIHAIDRDSIVRQLVGGGAQVLHAVCHPAQFGCDDSRAPRYTYDPPLARRLLGEAGYPAGLSLDLSTIVSARDRNSIEAIIGYLAAVGIRAQPRYYVANEDLVFTAYTDEIPHLLEMRYR
jgi:peptide/nickel transport system substrate-binding protein